MAGSLPSDDLIKKEIFAKKEKKKVLNNEKNYKTTLFIFKLHVI